MFTIKHIHALGDEDVIQVSTVRYQPSKPGFDNGHTGQSPTPETVWVRESSSTERPLTGGTIFVMNEAGKTVARYDLGASPVPIIGDGLTDPRPSMAAPRQQPNM